MTELLMPNDVESEQILIGRMLNSINAVNSAFEKLKPSDFYDPRHSAIFHSMHVLYKADQEIEPLSVCKIMESLFPKENDLAYLYGLTQYSAYSGDAVDLFIGKIKDTSFKRRMISLSQGLVKKSASGDQTSDQLYAEAISGIDAIMKDYDDYEVHTPKTIMASDFNESGMNFIEYLQHKQEMRLNGQSTLEGLPTFMDKFDEMLDGLNKKHFIIIAARPGIGKSSLAIQWMLNMITKGGMSIGFFSLEMTKTEVFGKMASNLASVAWRDAVNGVLDPNDFHAFLEAAKSLETTKLYIDDQPGLTLSQLSSRAKRWKMSYDVDAIFIDYLGEVKGDGKFSNKQEEVAAVSKGLRGLAKSLNVPIVCIAQLNRSSEMEGNKSTNTDRLPKKSDLRDSGQIEADAHSIIMLHRPNQSDTPNENDYKSPGRLDAYIVKNRFGREGHINMSADLAKGRFETIDYKPYQTKKIAVELDN